MSTDLQLGSERMDALREIGNIGAGNAATSLSQMMGAAVQMGIPTVKFLPDIPTSDAPATVLDRLGPGE